jgi:hypothetical protein
MFAYSVGILPLIRQLKAEFLEVEQPFGTMLATPEQAANFPKFAASSADSWISGPTLVITRNHPRAS